MIEFLKQLPHLEPYGTPVYFIYLIGALLPIFVGLFFKKRFPVYEALVSLTFIVLMLTGTDLKQIYAVLSTSFGKSFGSTPINSIEASVITSGSFIFTLSWSFYPWFL